MTGPMFPDVQASKSRLLISLVLDTSSSMVEDDAIGQLNRALQGWRESLAADHYLQRTGEVSMVTFGAGGVRVVDPAGGPEVTEPFVPISRFQPATLRAGGYSPMTAGIKQAIRLIDERRRTLAGAGIQMAYPPLVYLLTDGAPSDDRGQTCPLWPNLVPELRRQEHQQGLLFFAFGVRGADRKVLEALAPQRFYQAEGTDFTTVLTAVRQSIERVIRNDGSATEQVIQAQRAQAEVMNWILAETQQNR
jgi:uncharacterized protein YegL